jgi:hypothetical protein
MEIKLKQDLFSGKNFLQIILFMSMMILMPIQLSAACECPAGATNITSTTGITLTSNTDYCISNDLTMTGNLVFQTNTTLTVADGVKFDFDGSLSQAQSPSEFNICEGAKVVVHGSYTQTGNTGASYNATTPNVSKLQMDEYAGLEICGGWTGTPTSAFPTTTIIAN